MPRKPKVQRTPEEKWQIVLEGLKGVTLTFHLVQKIGQVSRAEWAWAIE
jgi:hypothetical protein